MAAVAATPTLRAKLRMFAEALFASGVVGDNGGARFEISQEVDLTNGTSTGQADKAWFGDRTLAASATENYDLAGTLTDIFGNALTFVKVKYIAVKVTTTTDGVDLSLGPVTAGNGFGIGTFWNAAADKSIVPAGGFIEMYDPNGAAVTAATADLLTAINRSGSTGIAFKILIIGTSA